MSLSNDKVKHGLPSATAHFLCLLAHPEKTGLRVAQVGHPSNFRQSRQRRDRIPNCFSGLDEIPQHCRVGVEMPFVFRDVAHLVRLGQHPPNSSGHSQRVRQRLNHQIAAVGAIAVPAQCRQRKSMCRVVSQIKPARKREIAVLRIRQTFAPGIQKASDLVLRSPRRVPAFRRERDFQVPRLSQARSSSVPIRNNLG